MKQGKNNNNVESVTAAGAVVHRKVFGKQEVLLIFRNGKWDLPKGKQEENESIRECARRELAEETGVVCPDLGDFLAKTTHTYRRNNKTYHKTTHWFSVGVEGNVKTFPQNEEGIEKVQWVPLNNAPDKLAYQNLKEVIKAFQTPEA
jgi:8-oxo-dGTP pyrophosphatase MutT (NUDIX family)